MKIPQPLPATITMAFVAGLSLAATAWAQTAPPTFGDSVDVQLINVEVWVTDRQGNPITGLGKESFELREDGEVVAISNFAEIRDSLPGDPFAPTAPIEAALEEPVRERTLELEDLLREDAEADEGAAGGFLALYFDELFSGITGRKQLIEDLRTFIELRRVPPSKVLILSQGENLRVEANLGSSRAELEAALDRLKRASPEGVRTWAAKKNALRRLQSEWERVAVLGNSAPGQDPCDSFASVAFREIQLHVDSSLGRIQQTLTHLDNTAGFLAGLPGPKTLIYISDGLPTSPGLDLLSFVKHLCPARSVERRLDHQEGLNEAFRRLSRHASANRVTIHSIQALGLRQMTSLSGVEQKSVAGTTRAMRRYDSESRIQNRGGLVYLARETGGRAVINRNVFIEELEQIAEDMTGYYSLAYAPPHAGDGLEHKIDVKVSGDGFRVRHRPGYRDKSLDQRMLERLESTLYLNLMANPLGVKLAAGEVKAAEKDKYTVPLHVQVPVEKVTFLPGQGGDRARLRVLVLARDERNVKAAFKQEQYDLTRPTAPAPDQQFSLLIQLELPAGIHVVAFGVRDEATQVASFVATGLEIQKPPAGGGDSP